MNVRQMIVRLSAEPPQLLILDAMPYKQIVHAVRDEAGEPRREVFVMAGPTWTLIEHDVCLIGPIDRQRWSLRRVNAGELSHDGRWLKIPLPIAIVFPWSCLVSDDKRFAPAIRGEKAVLLMTEAYRNAKQKAETIAIAAAVGMRPRSDALELRARVFVPDNHRRDVVNFSKCLHDILIGTILLDDSQIHRSTWERAGCDIDAPRAEILITAYGR